MNAQRQIAPDVATLDQLNSESYRFTFFQAVRLLKRIEAGRTGESTSLLDADPTIRFRTPASLDFPASEISDYRRIETGDATAARHELTVLFLGLTGPSSTLPRHYTELLIARRFNHRDSTLHEFLDLFTHRLVALFYEAWEKHRFYLPYERGATSPFAQIVLDLIGLGPGSLQRRMMGGGVGLKDQTLVYYGGLASQRPRSAANLGAMVQDHFKVPATVRQMIGRWLRVPAEVRSVLGATNNALGHTFMLGDRTWECGSKIELVLGPLPRARFEALLPGGIDHIPLTRLIRWFVGAAIDCSIQLVLRKEEVTPVRLGQSIRLGHTAWIATTPPPTDFDRVVYDCPP